MYLKSTAFVTFLFIMLITSQKSAYAEPTKWEDAKVGMNTLLDSGWQIIGHAATRVKASDTPVSSGFNEVFFSFILINKGKYIMCVSDNPKPPIARASSCRNLN